ncbi:MAG TPA: sodium-dependent transporter [Gemmatimonadaceae bacterium]|nr:sodium-dependent transporter [Gemmatimonadaceae bacterium]
MSSAPNEAWGSRLGVILAVAGSAVGLGNFLRFPGQAAENGGGAFLIPYFCALFLLGIPIGWAEWTMGRYGGSKGLHGAPMIMGAVGQGRLARYLGVLGVLIPLGVSTYYVFIETWTFAYFLKYLSGGIGIVQGAPIAEQTAASAQFYALITGVDGDGSLFTGDSRYTVVSWVVVFAINMLFVFRGLSKGIEKFVSFAMPIMAVCALVVLVRVLTLGTPDPAQPTQNVMNGLGYMWNPDFGALTNFKTWLAAASQIFFSLSVGFGVIINYASYMKRTDDVALSGLTATATNELFEVGFGGMITLTAAFVFLGLSGTTAAVATGSFGLGFNTLPVVFAQMGAFENVIGALWFFMLWLAAITSSLSMYQPAVAHLKEATGLGHARATSVIAVIGTIGAVLTLWFTAGGGFWSTVDFWVGTYLIFVLAMVQIIYFGWVFGIDRGWRELHRGASITVPSVFKVIMRYIAPAYLIIVFVGFTVQNFRASLVASWASTGSRVGLLTIAAILVYLLVVTWLGERRLRAAGVDIDDHTPSA